MVRSIVITGASKGIGRAAADALAEGGWSVIGVARSSPASFPGVFVEADLADRTKTQDLAEDLNARGNVVGIVNNVGLARHERVDYAAAKAALESITRTMAIELAADGITANAVAPGPTETELFRSNNPQGSEGEARYLSRVPMRRFAHPSEVAAAIAFLASNAAGFITGQTLFVDGGASLGTL